MIWGVCDILKLFFLSRGSKNLHFVRSEPRFSCFRPYLCLKIIFPITFKLKDDESTIATIYVIGLIFKHGQVTENALKAWF